ncbi:hypothetical protein HLB44_11885 [Aquincola sp. S2]|uniref:Uncharacterized protein n=1 Tax=Pseudaquabacterium terrae TaxID=2732868 RepID=A0ABX2EGF5_9BURK|nr:hypothetical protein [Aquabacterium terrae]NRF67686.1 hypothetical protein [Aquabacterium terrae]
MSAVMSFAQWMNLTDGGFTSIRSSELKAIDTALKYYHDNPVQARKDRLAAALLKWMQSKGAAWKTSVRNKNRAVETLYAQVTGLGGPNLSGEERVGLAHVRDESQAILQQLFRGQRLEWRNTFKAKLGEQKTGLASASASVLINTRELSGVRIGGTGGAVGGNTGQAMAIAEDLVRSVVSPENLQDVMRALASLMPAFMTQLAASLVPFLGVLTSAGGTAWAAKNALRSAWRVESAKDHVHGSLAQGNPAAALEALIRLLQREHTNDVFAVSVSLGEFGGKLAGVLADGGTATNAAVGLAASVIRLMNIVRVIERDVRERNAANTAMRTRVDRKIFETCPVVGAYLICCAPTSVMCNAIFDERFGEVGWQDQVETAVRRHLGALREQARRVITAHRFWIPGLAHHAGLMAVNEKKLKQMLASKGKTGMVGFGSDNLPAALRA